MDGTGQAQFEGAANLEVYCTESLKLLGQRNVLLAQEPSLTC